jgi:hypothetical protein
MHSCNGATTSEILWAQAVVGACERLGYALSMSSTIALVQVLDDIFRRSTARGDGHPQVETQALGCCRLARISSLGFTSRERL